MEANRIRLLAPRDQALFDGLNPEEVRGFFEYLFTEPSTPGKAPSLRSSLAISLYDPFCDRRVYPLGILWQCGPYSGCSHNCAYCYGRSYLPNFELGGRAKSGFRSRLNRCLMKMKELGLPPRHLSVGNSTDALQEHLESKHRDTLFLLERVYENRTLFGSICMLTKNPGVLLDDPRYVSAILGAAVEIQVSLAFYRDEPARQLEPGAPLPSDRRKAAEGLTEQGVKVALRLDPLFPRGIPDCKEYQSLELDIVPMIGWAKTAGVEYVISKPLKLPKKGSCDPQLHDSLQPAFPKCHGCYWRMPTELQGTLMSDVREICSAHGLRFTHCFHNILERNTTLKSHHAGEHI